MPLSLFESAYIRSRAAISEADWSWLTDLQRTDRICCEMQRLSEMERHREGAPDAPVGKLSRRLAH